MLKCEFEPFCIRNQGGMFKIAMKVTQNCQTAEDAVQEALFRIFRAFPSLQFETERQERVYALRAAKNAALDILKMENRHDECERGVIEQLLCGQTDATVAAVLARDLDATVTALLNELPEKAKAIFSFREMGLSDAQIAQTLSISVSDVRTTTFRARKKMSESLKGGASFEPCR